ncbi:MAG TPA: SDR family oxidoreductase [Candidatus Limnocylindria bacterium]|jgi:NAD(P)-dependent dehydrogenase (short-subunit alcohol dehydrogenase family)|nr:SDR family oxidoreductase [Candidatus Limnocylindria bacterium]
MDLQLNGKVAAITGGSRGIGKAIARALAREGVDVALIARDLATAEATAAEIAGESGRTARAYRADTGKDEDVRSAFAAIAADFGRIDILVNNAAKVAGHGAPPTLATITDDDFYGDVNIKVMGYVRCAREAAPIMQRQGFGRIINISGLAARWTGSIVGSIRNVSVAALTANLAEELGPHGINVTCVHPGLTRTEKTPGQIERRAAAAGVAPDEMEQRMSQNNMIRHIVTAEEVADVVTFLASPKSIAVTGDVIAAGGGSPGVIYY